METLESLQIQRIKSKLQKHIDHHDRALIISNNIYAPNSAATVVFTKLYPHFVKGYVLNKLSGYKEPYTVTYNQLICKDFNEESQWEDGSSLYD